MMFSASEGAAQIDAPSIARMGQKTNAAVDAVRYALAQTRMVPQDRIKSVLILPDKRVNPLLEMPVFTKCEKLGDPDDKKERDCDITSNSCTPSCYTIHAKASRSNTRFFSAHQKITVPNQDDQNNHSRLRKPPTLPTPPPQTENYLEENPLSFPGSGAVI
jgi:hypothetical protein